MGARAIIELREAKAKEEEEDRRLLIEEEVRGGQIKNEDAKPAAKPKKKRSSPSDIGARLEVGSALNEFSKGQGFVVERMWECRTFEVLSWSSVVSWFHAWPARLAL